MALGFIDKLFYMGVIRRRYICKHLVNDKLDLID